ncbi:MAG TPA: response regulator, partial [Longimicrobiaceae bacterium]|nr:response regulator [Longimicrobiaceae bacterium]
MPRVLVVDDQRIPRVTLAAILGEAGHEVVTEGTGLDGIARARVWSPDVIVLDVHMPEMDGFQVVERLKRDPDTAATPVIFLTAEPPTDDLIVRGLDLGAYDFLSKGCSKAELLARVGVMARIKRGNDELSAIARISDTLIRSLDPLDLSRLFVEQTREVFRADASLFVRPQPDGMRALRVADGLDVTEPLSDRLIETLLSRLGEHGRESDVIPPEHIPGPAGAIVRRYGFRSAIATRVEHDSQSPTLLAVFTERQDGFRRESDAPLLHLLARQATIALDNALLHVQTREQAKKMEEQAEALEQAISQRSRFFAS